MAGSQQRDYVDGKAKLRAYQEAYGAAMKSFGLARGLPSEHTQAHHHPTEEYYRSLAEIERAVDQRLEALQLTKALEAFRSQSSSQSRFTTSPSTGPRAKTEE